VEGDSGGGGELEGLRKAGEQRPGSGILKVIERGRNWGKLRNIAQNYAIEKSAQRREPTKIGRELGFKVREAGGLTALPFRDMWFP